MRTWGEASRARALLVEVSTRFIGLPIDRIGEETEDALRALVETLGTDRSTLFQFSPDGKSLRAVASWARPGVAPLAIEIVHSEVPWYHAQLVQGETIRLNRIPDDLPCEAVKEREYTNRVGMKSNLTIPIVVGERPVCAIATGAFHEAYDWSDPIVECVRLVGHILANALHRQRVETDLRDAVAGLKQTQQKLEARLEEIHELKEMIEAENRYLRTEIKTKLGSSAIIGRSTAMSEVLALVAHVAPTQSTVLLLGETGTGKGLLAQAIHDLSPRRNGPLIKVNCSALPPTLIESELFGHEKGAFTGATRQHVGRFELAEGGTLFLDEIGELAPDLQVKLLRFLQDGKFERVGSTQTRTADVRIVAATNRDLAGAMREGRFREDLYFRLSVFPIQVPPLRERREDIPLLVWAFINRRQAALGRNIDRVAKNAMESLMARRWPGNVRELENVVERALILSKGSTLRLEERASMARPDASPPDADLIAEVERSHIRRVLEACSWKIDGRDHAAQKLGLNPSTLRSRMQKLGISRPARDGTGP